MSTPKKPVQVETYRFLGFGFLIVGFTSSSSSSAITGAEPYARIPMSLPRSICPRTVLYTGAPGLTFVIRSSVVARVSGDTRSTLLRRMISEPAIWLGGMVSNGGLEDYETLTGDFLPARNRLTKNLLPFAKGVEVSKESGEVCEGLPACQKPHRRRR